MRLLVCILFCGLTLTSALGQSNDDYVNVHNKSASYKSNDLTLGAGLAGFCLIGSKNYSEGGVVTLSYAAFHVGNGTINFGGLFSYRTSGTYIDYTYYNVTEQGKTWAAGLRSYYDWILPGAPKCDVYLGAMAAYYDASFQSVVNYPSGSADEASSMFVHNNDVAVSAFFGMHYFITNKLGIWTEIAYGYTPFSFGISYTL